MLKHFGLIAAALTLLILTACASNLPRVEQIRIEVSDMNASSVFYRTILGFQPKVIGDGSVLQGENIELVLAGKSPDWQPPRREGERLSLGMYPQIHFSDLYLVTYRARKAGYTVVQDPIEHAWGSDAYISDPDGYVWGLFNWRKKW